MAGSLLRGKGFIRPSISEALSADLRKGNICPHGIREAKLNPVIVAEIELVKVAMQVLLATMLTDAFMPSLKIEK